MDKRTRQGWNPDFWHGPCKSAATSTHSRRQVRTSKQEFTFQTEAAAHASFFRPRKISYGLRAPALLQSLIAYLRAAVPRLHNSHATLGDEEALLRGAALPA